MWIDHGNLHADCQVHDQITIDYDTLIVVFTAFASCSACKACFPASAPSTTALLLTGTEDDVQACVWNRCKGFQDGDEETPLTSCQHHIKFGCVCPTMTFASVISFIISGTFKETFLEGWSVFSPMSASGPLCHAATCVAWKVSLPSNFRSAMSIWSEVNESSRDKVMWNHSSSSLIHGLECAFCQSSVHLFYTMITGYMPSIMEQVHKVFGASGVV